VVFYMFSVFFFFFFFQAEDGIRDFHVTGVQTCALPICCLLSNFYLLTEVEKVEVAQQAALGLAGGARGIEQGALACMTRFGGNQIGRASCRERVEHSEVERVVKQK